MFSYLRLALFIGTLLLFKDGVAVAKYCEKKAPPKASNEIQECNVLGLPQGKIEGSLPADIGIYVQGEYLYWEAREEGLEYAYVQSNAQNPALDLNANTVSTIQNGSFKTIDFSWKSGVRLTAGAHLPLDSWNLYAEWTGISSHFSGSSHIGSIDQANIAPIWLGSGYYFSGYDRVLNASGKWHLHYNTLKLALMKDYYESARFLLALHTGLQGAWINQQYQASYRGGTLSSAYFKGKLNFEAPGIYSAFNGAWALSKYWKILGKMQGALNFGRYKISQQIFSGVNDGSVQIPLQLRDQLHEIERRIRFSYEAAIGLEFGVTHKSGTKITLQAMYDLIQWFHLNQFRRFSYADSRDDRYFFSSNGNFGLQGISIAGRLEF